MKYCIGILGSPAVPEYEWTDDKLTELKSLGFNTMQLNIAWGWRPNDEPLNLEDIIALPGQNDVLRKKVEERRERVRRRITLCKKNGLRTIFHFGAPFNGPGPYQGKPPANCFYDDAVREHYLCLLDRLAEQVPGIDDILVYTYDQDAWLCSEFANCKRCRGVPLHKRLPVFLSALCGRWASHNPDGRLWWEPWELSAGQALRMVQDLPTEHFGLIAHSNVGEVQKARPVDLWFKDMAMLADRRGIPLVAELFLGESCEETEPFKRIPCPRLTYTQIKAVMDLPGVVGVKEYYGLFPQTEDPCLAMVGEVLKHPDDAADTCLARLSEAYGPWAQDVRDFWEHTADAYMLFPWDVSWYAREIGRADIDHGWSAAFLRGQQCSTPSWESSRHSIFMKTDDARPHPWMLEDIQLRCALAADHLRLAVEQGNRFVGGLVGLHKQAVQEAIVCLEAFMRVCISYELHLRETNVTMLLREEKELNHTLPAFLLDELDQLLQRDVDNQLGQGRVVAIQAEYRKDPSVWLDRYLLPSHEDKMERGYFSLTTR